MLLLQIFWKKNFLSNAWYFNAYLETYGAKSQWIPEETHGLSKQYAGILFHIQQQIDRCIL